jgi:metabotropic glutamate receptor 2/3
MKTKHALSFFSYEELAPVQVVMNAVQAMANGVDALQKHLCPNTTKICDKMRPLNRKMLLKFLRNVTYTDAAFHFPVSFNAKQEVDGNYTIFNFRRNDKGKYEYIQVGSWVSKLNSDGEITGNLRLNNSKIRWANGSNTVPLSTCTPKCAPNEISKIREDECCHKCHPCGENDIVVNNTCRTCDEGYVPNLNESRCMKLPLKYINMDTALAGFLVFFACLGILVDAVVFAVFLKYSNNKLIKASGREMCYFMFVGICATFIVPLSSLAKPTQAMCYFRRFIMGVSFTICYAPLLMKMFRIHRIFKNANQLRRLSPSNLIGRRSLLMITTGLVAVQGLFCALVFSSDPPILLETFYPQRNELVLECDFKKSSFVIYFMYNAVLIVWCTFYAFRTRHFPKNFNEAMYIGITMYLTCVVWVVFFATFLNADYSISRVYWLSSTSLVIGWITLLGLFGPKLYQLYTKTEYPTNMLLTWGESTFPKVESSVDIAGACQRCAEIDEQVKASKGSRDKGSRDEKSREIPLQPTGENGFANPGTQ